MESVPFFLADIGRTYLKAIKKHNTKCSMESRERSRPTAAGRTAKGKKRGFLVTMLLGTILAGHPVCGEPVDLEPFDDYEWYPPPRRPRVRYRRRRDNDRSPEVDTPATNVKINPDAEKLNENEHGDCRRYVGRLIHISFDRVDIQYAVKQLTKDVQGPTFEP